jgi:hypothetical protein
VAVIFRRKRVAAVALLFLSVGLVLAVQRGSDASGTDVPPVPEAQYESAAAGLACPVGGQIITHHFDYADGAKGDPTPEAAIGRELDVHFPSAPRTSFVKESRVGATIFRHPQAKFLTVVNDGGWFVESFSTCQAAAQAWSQRGSR